MLILLVREGDFPADSRGVPQETRRGRTLMAEGMLCAKLQKSVRIQDIQR